MYQVKLRQYIFFVLAIACVLFLLPVETKALITIPPGGSTDQVDLYADFAQNYILPSPGDTVTATLKVANTSDQDIEFSGEIGLNFFTIGGNANNSQAYFTNPSPRKSGKWTVPAGGSIVESFSTGITGGGCTSGDVNLKAVPSFLATVSYSQPGIASTTGGIGASMYGNVFKSNNSWASGATVVVSSATSDGKSTTTSPTGFYKFKNLNCAYTHTASVSNFQGESGSTTIAAAPSGLCNGEERGPFVVTLQPVSGPPPPAATPTPTPTPVPGGGGGACGEYINGALDTPTAGSIVSSPVTFSGRYWCQPGKCFDFTAQAANSWIGVDVGPNYQGGTQYKFSDGGSIGGGSFSKSIALSPGQHQVFVHVEGWANPSPGGNVWVDLSNIQSCSSQTITVTTPSVSLNDASVCTAISVNSGNAVYTGKNYPAQVSLRNAGTSSWTWNQPNPYKLGAQDPQDNNVWGLSRVDLPSSPIAPASSATFNFNIWAPQTAGTYSFNWQMVHEGIQWFGSRCLYNVNVQNPPFTFTPACTGTVTNAATKTIRWETSVNPASPPTGSYTYLWSGDASGSSSSVTQTYATAGVKNAQVTVTNSATSKTASCSTVISPPGTPPAPTVSTLLSCLDAGYSGSGLTISWTNPNVSWVDIDTDANFAEAYYHKAVSGVSSTTAPNGFGAFPSGGSLSLNPTTTYFVRTYNGVQNSQVGSFTTPSSCSAPSQPVSPTPAPAGSTPAPSSCFGNILLTIIPNPTAGLTTLTAASSGLTNCVGIPIAVRQDDCSGSRVTGCTSGSTGCIANFVAPPAAGSYTYASCIDKPPSDGDYTDAGESDTTILIINPPKSSVNSAWIQTTGGDVHSNTKINTPGGP